MPQPGEVLLIPFPYTDLASSKRRPVLVLREADAFGDFLAAAITSQPGHTDAIPLDQHDFEKGRLPKPSYVRVTKLYTLNTQTVAAQFGRLTPIAYARVHGEICITLRCSGEP